MLLARIIYSYNSTNPQFFTNTWYILHLEYHLIYTIKMVCVNWNHNPRSTCWLGYKLQSPQILTMYSVVLFCFAPNFDSILWCQNFCWNHFLNNWLQFSLLICYWLANLVVYGTRWCVTKFLILNFRGQNLL